MALLFTALRHGTGVAADSSAVPNDPSDAMPPRYLAAISIHGNPDPKDIVWGETRDGLAVGIARLRTSLESPVWPIIDAYLKNRGSVPITGAIQSRANFLLELDGQKYSEVNSGGKSWPLSPGKQLGPIAVDTIWFHRVDKLVPYQVVNDSAPAPTLSAGEHTLRLYFNLNNRLIPSAPVTFTVRLRPYPMEAGVAQIAKDLNDRNTYVRSMAAESAGRLRLSGARIAVTGALKDDDLGVRRSAARALGLIGNASTIKALKSVLDDRDMDVRVSAIESLVNLGAPFDIAWAEPIIRSKKDNAFENAVWLVRRYGGDMAAITLIRCLDMDDPSVKSYYNYTLVRQIGACGGPRLEYHHDFYANGTADQVEHNRKVLAEMQNWLRTREQRKK
jgi:hypothetical protein